ncbi:MAG: B12-binding domain-containing protein [Euryarchaeota archaeon]|nr:B12-binding domain-containing protein [Euryarchaeota archaeon]
MDEIARFKKELKNALLQIDANTAKDIIYNRMADLPPYDRVQMVISPVLEEIGTGWENGDAALANLYFSSKICEEIVLNLLNGNMNGKEGFPKVAIATLEDYHLLGSKVVRMSIQSTGQKIIEYGRMDVPGLVDKVCDDGVDYLLISTLMLRSALKVKDLREKLDSKGCKVKIIVGGAPFRFDWGLWRRVDADFTASLPLMALEYIKRDGEPK